MRQFFLVMLTGCLTADSLIEPPGEQDDSPLEPIDGVSEQARFVPAICEVELWNAPIARSQMSIARDPRDGSALVVAASREGGPVRGFRVDARGQLTSPVATIHSDGNYTGAAASFVAGRFVIAARTDSTTSFSLVRDDLGAHHALGTLDGTLVAPVAVMRGSALAIGAGGDGLVVQGFEGALWSSTPARKLLDDDIVSITAAPYHPVNDSMIAWSTADKQCHLLRVAANRESARDFACEGAQLAFDPTSRRGVLVYEDGGDVYLTRIELGGESELLDRVRLAPQASSPRAVFDGTRLWASYVDAHGQVVVGFFDGDHFVTRGVPEVRPGANDYQLSAFGGSAWILAELGGRGVGALRTCLMPR